MITRRRLVFVLLILCVAAVGVLLSYGAGEGVARRGGGSAARARAQARQAPASASQSPAANSEQWKRRWAEDDDPNRVPGTPVTLTGVVKRGEALVPAANVALFRSRPRYAPTLGWQERDRWAIEIARTACDRDGRFSLTIPRRMQLMILADAPGAAFAWQLVLIPAQGDPDEITIQLGDGLSLASRVVDAGHEPLEGVVVSVAFTAGSMAPPLPDATTDEQGLARFAGLRAGSYRVTARPSRAPSQRRWAQVPATREVLFELVAGGSIAGRVTNARGEPVAGATLRMEAGESFLGISGQVTATTNAAGEYRIEQALPGPLRSVVLRHGDYGTLRSTKGEIAPPTDLVRAGAELRFDIQLAAGVPVSGLVVLAGTDTAVAGAAVKLLRLTDQDVNLAEVNVTTTDASGRFLFASVREGTYALEALGRQAARIVQRASNGRQPVTIDFYVDGEHAPTEQRIELSGTGTVQGRILGFATNPGQQAIVQVTVGGVTRRGVVDGSGHYVIEHLAPAVFATVQGWNPTVKSEPFEVVAGATVEVDLHADALGGWAGVVKDEQGSPLAGAKVMALAQSQLKSQLRTMLQQNWGHATTDEQGRFLIPIQEWARKNQGNQKWVVAALHLDYQLAMTKDLELPKLGEQTEIELKLSKGGVIRGSVTVEGGGSAANLYVRVFPVKQKGEPFETRPSRNARTDLDGRFEISGVGQGAHQISTSSATGRMAPADQVHAGDTGVTLVIRPTESIAGIVIDDDGLPIAQAQVSAIIPRGKRRGGFSQGRFRIANLEPGSYEIEVAPRRGGYRGNGQVFETKRVGPVATGTDDVVITVSWGNRLSGRVLGPRGPAGGMSVIALPIKIDRKQRRQQRPRAITNGRGEFTLKGMGRDEVELLVSGPGYRPATLRVAPGSGEVTIYLEAGGKIAGRVLKPDGRPLANQWLNLQPKSPSLTQLFQSWQRRAGSTYGYRAGYSSLGAATDGRGRFEFDNLVPGEYGVYLRSDQGVAPPLTIRTGTANVLIQLEPALSIRGMVTDQRGAVRVLGPGQRLYVYARQGSRGLSGAQVGDDGSFEIRGLPAGRLTLQVYGGNKYNQVKMEVASGDQSVRVVLTERAKR